MTYCIAWKSMDTVFMISDTARTVKDNTYKPTKNISSLGEDFYQAGNLSVEEWVHKQFRIGNSMIMTFAGDIELGLEIINSTRRVFTEEEPLKAFEMALDAVRDPAWPIDVHFFIGIRSGSNTQLFTYNYNAVQEGKIVEVANETLVQIGSLSQPPYNELTRKMYYEHVIELKTPVEQFYQALAFVQHLGLHSNTFSMYAGGVYTGISLDVKGVHWAEDTTIVLYDRNMTNENSVKFIGNVNHFVRHDVFTISSTFTKQAEFFIDQVNNPVYLSGQLRDDIEKEHRLFQPKVMVFLAKDDRLIIVVKTNGNNCNDHFFYKNVDGKQELFFYDNFLDILKLNNKHPTNFSTVYWTEVIKDIETV